MAVILSINSLAIVYLVLVILVWTRRVFWMSGFRKTNPPLRPITQSSAALHDKVSVIVPARNEEKNIARCLFHLMKQNYPNLEIITVDDRSEDRTGHLVENFKMLSGFPFKTVRIDKLPPGWTGKNHAMFVGSKAATGDWLLFTDADTTHQKESVRTALTAAIEQKIDLLTLAPETECRSFWEKTVQPLAVSSLALWFDKAVVANGQFILIRRKVYETIGGNESVQTEVVEDVALAKKVKAAGYTLKFLNGTRLYSTRMYSSLLEIKTGWTRIFTYLFNKNALAVLHKIYLFLAFSLGPFILLACAGYFDRTVSVLSAAACVWIIVIRFFGNKMLKCDPWSAFLHPLSSLVMLWIMMSCLGRILFNRPSVWRGDVHR